MSPFSKKIILPIGLLGLFGSIGAFFAWPLLRGHDWLIGFAAFSFSVTGLMVLVGVAWAINRFIRPLISSSAKAVLLKAYYIFSIFFVIGMFLSRSWLNQYPVFILVFASCGFIFLLTIWVPGNGKNQAEKTDYPNEEHLAPNNEKVEDRLIFELTDEQKVINRRRFLAIIGVGSLFLTLLFMAFNLCSILRGQESFLPYLIAFPAIFVLGFVSSYAKDSGRQEKTLQRLELHSEKMVLLYSGFREEIPYKSVESILLTRTPGNFEIKKIYFLKNDSKKFFVLEGLKKMNEISEFLKRTIIDPSRIEETAHREIRTLTPEALSIYFLLFTIPLLLTFLLNCVGVVKIIPALVPLGLGFIGFKFIKKYPVFKIISSCLIVISFLLMIVLIIYYWPLMIGH